MNTSRFALIVLPLAVLVLLAQSILWIPAYDSADSRNATRLHTFIETSIGDARLLNPVLMADTASARIVDLVFDGLLRIDDELKLRGSLAERWSVRERAYLLLADSNNASATAQALQARLTQRDAQLLAGPVVIHPERIVQHELAAGEEGEALSVSVSVPPRIELVLRRVEPDLSNWITEAGFTLLSIEERRKRFTPTTHVLSDSQVEALLPNLEHNPEITFWLRKGVLFHDGHRFDAGDVVFTYQAIMDPANRSPHRASFEPVKSVQALGAHRVRVVYKRLFSPAVNVWTIGIVPEHLLNESAMHREREAQAVTGDELKPPSLRDSRFNRNPVGTGPFRFKRWTSDELIHLTRNDGYRREAAINASEDDEQGRQFSLTTTFASSPTPSPRKSSSSAVPRTPIRRNRTKPRAIAPTTNFVRSQPYRLATPTSVTTSARSRSTIRACAKRSGWQLTSIRSSATRCSVKARV